MSGEDYLERVRGERSLLERIMGYIPGYRGYREKELRRESDRLVRMEVVNRLRDAKTTLRRSFANLSIAQKLSIEDTYKYEALLLRLDRVTQRIDRAAAGYAGMFDAVKVREDKLGQVLQYDVSLIERVESIRMDVEKIVKMDVDEEEWREAMDSLTLKVDALDKLIDQRSEILRRLQG